MSAAKIVEVVIYDAPAAATAGCGCGCGHHHGHDHGHEHGDHQPQISVEWQAKALAMTLDKAFPGRVKVEYINVLQDPRGPSLPQTALLCSLAYPSPLVYLNGKGRFAGAVPVDRITAEINRLLQE